MSQVLLPSQLDSVLKDRVRSSHYGLIGRGAVVEGLPDGWLVFRVDMPDGPVFAPLRAVHAGSGVSILASPESLVDRVAQMAKAIRTYEPPPVYPYTRTASFVVHVVEDQYRSKRYFVQTADDTTSYAPAVMFEHGERPGYRNDLVLAVTEVPPTEPAPVEEPVVGPPDPFDKAMPLEDPAPVREDAGEPSPRRVQGRPAGQQLSDRPTRHAVELMGNAANGRSTDGPPVMDVIKALMEDGAEYSDAFEVTGRSDVGNDYAAAVAVLRFTGKLPAEPKSPAAVPPPF